LRWCRAQSEDQLRATPPYTTYRYTGQDPKNKNNKKKQNKINQKVIIIIIKIK
jgi:hypothetical protein